MSNTLTPPATTPTMRDPRERVPEHTVVRMVNNGPEEFVARYTGQEYRVPANSQAFVPFYAMCLWAGHPDAVDIDKKRRWRTDELQRLQVKYGTHSFNGCWTTEICDGNPDMKGPKHPPRRHLPNISFFSVDTNEPYATVLDDPHGTQATQVASVATQDDLANRAMRDLQAQVLQLQRDLAAMQNNTGTPTIPPAPEPHLPPHTSTTTSIPVNEDGEQVEDIEDDWDDNPVPVNGPLDHAIPVDESEIEGVARKPRIPPAPGPLR